MKKKLLNLLLLTLTGASLLTGCGQEVQTAEATSNISFSWWGNDDRHMYTMNGVNEFMDNNLEIHVDYRYGEWSGYERRNRVWMESKTEADIMQINYGWLTDYSNDGEGYYDLYELTEYIDLSTYDESDLEYGKKNGKLNAIPIAFNVSTLCYNKTMFDEYGLECPKDWDELLVVADEFAKHDKYVLGLSKKHLFLMLVAYYEQTYGEHVFDDNGHLIIDKDGIAIMLDYYKELIDRKAIMPIEQFDRDKFGEGQTAMALFWISDADNYCKAVESNGGTPVIADYFMADNATLSGIYMKPATMYAISSVTDDPEAAAILLDYLINSKEMAIYQGTEKGVPVSSSARQALEEENLLSGFGYDAYENMTNHKEELSVMKPIMESEAINDAFKNDADAYIYDKETREDTIEKIYQDIKAISDQ